MIYICLDRQVGQTDLTFIPKVLPNDINSLITWLKQKWLFGRAGFYPVNQSNLKSIQQARIG